MLNIMRSFVLAAAVGLFAPWHAGAQAGAIVAYTNPFPYVAINPVNLGGNGYTLPIPGATWILGEDFVVNSPISVTAVGAFDYLQAGFDAGGVEVSLYEVSGGTLTQVPGTSYTFSGVQPPSSFDGSSTFYTLPTPVVLGVGTYAIAAANYGNDNIYWNASFAPGASPAATFQTASTAITMDSPTSFYQDGYSTLPATLDGGSLIYGSWGSGNPTWGGPTFDFTPVPEPGTLTLLAGSGLLAFASARRLRRKD